MDPTDPVRAERGADGVVTLVIDRPEVHNALDWRAMDCFAALVADLTVAAHRPGSDLRVVVVTGAGRDAFCSGGDQRALVADTGREAGERLASLMGDALARLEQLPVPVLAAVNGFALGGGAEIALACDLRFVDRAVRFGLVHLRLGLVPGWGGGQRLVRLAGPARAARMLLGAHTAGAEQLTAWGLADFVVAAGEARAAADTFAAGVAAADPGAVRAVKALLLAARAMDGPAALAAERRLFVDLWPAPAHLEALKAFGGPATGEQ